MLIRGLKRVAVVAVIAVAALYLKLKPRSAEVYTVDRGELAFEVMGTGTLEARVKTAVSPRIQERLDAVLVDQGYFEGPRLRGKAAAALSRRDAETKRQFERLRAHLLPLGQPAERVLSPYSHALKFGLTPLLDRLSQVGESGEHELYL